VGEFLTTDAQISRINGNGTQLWSNKSAPNQVPFRLTFPPPRQGVFQASKRPKPMFPGFFAISKRPRELIGTL